MLLLVHYRKVSYNGTIIIEIFFYQLNIISHYFFIHYEYLCMFFQYELSKYFWKVTFYTNHETFTDVDIKIDFQYKLEAFIRSYNVFNRVFTQIL
jgi:hypothetical protein